MSMFNDISWGSPDNGQKCNLSANFVSIHARRFSPRRWSFLGPGSETTRRMGQSRGIDDDKIWSATSPLSRGQLKSKGGGKLSFHFCADGDTIETVFRTIISVNQLSIYGAVSDVCEEYKAWHVRTGRPELAGQSDPSFAPANLLIMTPDLRLRFLHKKSYCKSTKNEWKGNHIEIVWLRFVLMQDFWQTVEVGQYFMTKHTDEFLQFPEPVTCREYTLQRDEKSTDPTGWIRGNTKIGPVLEVTTSYLQGKCGVEIINESVNKDNSHSWVRISHGLHKMATDLSNKEYDDNEQETCETKTEVFALKTEVFAFASRSKAKVKPRRPSTTCSSSRTVLIIERTWIDIEPGAQFDQAYPVAKRLNTLLRHGELHREEDGAIAFWRLKDDHRNKFEHSHHWSDDMWKSKMAGGGGSKKRFQNCTDPSGQEILYFRALQGHSGRNPIDPTLQDNVSILDNFFKYIYHIGCAVSLHSITNSGLIAGGQNQSKERQTVLFTAVNPMNKDHRDPQELDLTKTRLASYKQKWKRHQDTVSWVDIQLAQRKGLKFYQTRCNAIILYDTLPACCISKVVVMESG